MQIEAKYTKDVIQAALRELELGGGGFDTLLVAEYINAAEQSDVRVFQFSNPDSRHEVTKLISWCIRNDRLIRLLPYKMYATV